MLPMILRRWLGDHPLVGFVIFSLLPVLLLAAIMLCGTALIFPFAMMFQWL